MSRDGEKFQGETKKKITQKAQSRAEQDGRDKQPCERTTLWLERKVYVDSGVNFDGLAVQQGGPIPPLANSIDGRLH